MNKKTTIKLYDLDILDCEGKVNDVAVEDMGHEDGANFGRLYVNQTPCGAEFALVGLENNLKFYYCLASNDEFLTILAAMSKSVDYEVTKEGLAVAECEEALEYYFTGFLMGLSDVFLERFSKCRNCAAE